MPLQVLGFGNIKVKPITHFARIRLQGKYGEEVKINFNMMKNPIVSDLPGVSGHILKRFPHISERRSDLSAPIPRGAQKVHATIGLRAVVIVFNIKRIKQSLSRNMSNDERRFKQLCN